MRPLEAVDLAIGILRRNDHSFVLHENGTEIGIQFPNTIVFITAGTVDGETVLSLAADVVICIELTPESTAGLYNWVNERNREKCRARFVLHQGLNHDRHEHGHGWVSAEWEIAADGMEERELLGSLHALASQAGRLADPLKQVFGGDTQNDVLAEHRELFGPNPEHGDGPGDGPPSDELS